MLSRLPLAAVASCLLRTAVSLFVCAATGCGGGSFTSSSTAGGGGAGSSAGGSADGGSSPGAAGGGGDSVAGSDVGGSNNGATGGMSAGGASGTGTGGAGTGGMSAGGASGAGTGGAGTGGAGTGGISAGGASGAGTGGAGAGGSGGVVGCTALTTFRSQVNADTIIGSGTPSLNFGGGDVANVGVGIMSEGLFRFSIDPLPSTAKVQGARLRLSYAPVATACGTNCGSCANIDATGTLTAFFARSDWAEKTVTWYTPWSMPGGSLGGVDRSAAPVVTVKHVVDQDVLFTMTAADLVNLPTWRSSTSLLTFQIVPSNSAVFVAVTKEWSADNCSVSGTTPHSATLDIDYCP